MDTHKSAKRRLALAKFIDRLSWLVLSAMALVFFGGPFILSSLDLWPGFMPLAGTALAALYFCLVFATGQARRKLIAIGSPAVLGSLAESLYIDQSSPTDEDDLARRRILRAETINMMASILRASTDEDTTILTRKEAACLYRCLDPIWIDQESEFQLVLLDRISAWRDTRALDRVTNLAERTGSTPVEKSIRNRAIACREVLEEQAEIDRSAGSLLRSVKGAPSQTLLRPNSQPSQSSDPNLLRAAPTDGDHP